MLEAYFQVLRLYVTWEFLELMGLWCWPVVNATFTSPSRCATFLSFTRHLENTEI